VAGQFTNEGRTSTTHLSFLPEGDDDSFPPWCLQNGSLLGSMAQDGGNDEARVMMWELL
jgi:hypothetical protein